MAVARRVSFPGMLFYHYNSDKGKIIRPDRAWSVRDLKEAVREKENLDKSESARLRVVYQGNELGDRQLLTDCNFQEASTVHILKSGRQREGSQATRARPQTLFHVYCSDCKAIGEGRVLVKCSGCTKQSFVVKVGPKSWDEVFVKKVTFKGDCLNETCKAETREGKVSFHCGAHRGEEGSNPPEALPLPLIRTNTIKVKCMKCDKVSDPVLVFPCYDRHSLCIPCLEIYVNMALNSNTFVQHPESEIYTLGCPANCADSLIPETHYFKAISLYDRYKEMTTRDFVLKAGGVICDCGAAMLCAQFEVSEGATGNDEEEGDGGKNAEAASPSNAKPPRRLARKMSLQCTECKKVLCTRCKRDWHGESDCDGPLEEDRPKDVFDIEKKRAESACWKKSEFDPLLDAFLKTAKEKAVKLHGKKKWKWWPF